MPATIAPWIPKSNQELEAFQRKLRRHLLRRSPNFPVAILDSEIVPDAWAVGYAEYLDLLADPDIEEVRDREALLLSICVNEGEHLIRSSVRRDARVQIREAGGGDSEESMSITLEEIAASDPALTEKFSPVANAVKNDQRNVMLMAMSQLPETQLEAFRRVILHKQPQVEAARDLGIAIQPFERRLKKAVSQVAWAITQTCDQSLCETYTEITAAMSDPSNPNRAQQTEILKHVQSCKDCRYAIYESPFGEGGLAILLSTGLFTGSQGANVWERLTSVPVFDAPFDAAKSMWEKIWPGTHGAEAAVGTGTAAGGAGGTALAIGGGKALVTLCAGVATTACVAGVATGVIPIAKSVADRHEKDPPPTTAEVSSSPATPIFDSRAVYETKRASIEKTIARREAKHKARQKAKAAATADESTTESTNVSTTSSGTSSDSGQASYTSPVTTSPTTQTETNESSAASSMGIPTSGSSSSSGESSSSTSTAQSQTNQSSANDSFGIGQ